MITALIAGLVLGSLGSLHCIGMCGPIALSLPVHRHRGIMRLALILSYNTGRIATYTFFGIVAGLVGETLLFASSGRVLSVVAGVLIIVSVFAIFPGNPKLGNIAVFGQVRTALSNILSGRKKQGMFLLGLLNGLLPCGLVYIALSASVAQGSAANGALLMAAFGAGTLPAMLALPYAGSFVSLRFRNTSRRIVPYFVALTGALLILRGLGLGIPYVSPSFENRGMSCHEPTSNEPQTNFTCTGQASPHSK